MGRRSQQRMTGSAHTKRIENAKIYAKQREKQKQEQQRRQVELILKALFYDSMGARADTAV